MYVLKFKSECPEIMHEHFYDETVVVKNGVAICRGDHVKNALLGMNYDYIGTIDSDRDLKALFDKKLDEDFSVEVKKHTISLDDLLYEPEKTEQPEQHKPYLENLE